MKLLVNFYPWVSVNGLWHAMDQPGSKGAGKQSSHQSFMHHLSLLTHVKKDRVTTTKLAWISAASSGRSLPRKMLRSQNLENFRAPNEKFVSFFFLFSQKFLKHLKRFHICSDCFSWVPIKMLFPNWLTSVAKFLDDSSENEIHSASSLKRKHALEIDFNTPCLVLIPHLFFFSSFTREWEFFDSMCRPGSERCFSS